MKAMILAAGKGTRMLPLTETKPKPLIEIQGVSLLEHTILYLKYYGVDEIIINIHHFPEQIISFINKNKSFGIRIEFSDESGELLDTGGGLYKARGFFNNKEPFILTSSDVITDLNLNDFYASHQKNNALVTLAVKHRKSTRDFIFDQQFQLCGWNNNVTGESRIVKEPGDPIKIAFSTIHMLNPDIFKLIDERGRFSIIDLYLRLALQYKIMGYEHDHSAWYECGRFDRIGELNQTPDIRSIFKKYHIDKGIS
jgi:NDP-sugar pyrophosphorylase family protein